jgi:GNAT superfamily N-acetyltransferase
VADGLADALSHARVIGYDPRFRQAFADLNYQWIEQYFAIEAEDRKALDEPEAYALDTGGEIFFVLEGDAVVGTVAMVPVRDAGSQRRVFELAKMAVRPDRQGLGYSKLLMQACVEFAGRHNADEVMLVTNDRLKPALGLYLNAGFVAEEHYVDHRYARGNLQMRLSLKPRR